MQDLEVLRKLADGSAAELFLAREERSRDRVLVEIIRPELAKDERVAGRFLAEAKERTQLTHEHLLKRSAVGHTRDGRVFAVSEPVAGDHLGTVLAEQGPLGPGEAVAVLASVCDAVSYLHRTGLVHGNLCPANVYPGPPAKLVDTGLTLFRSLASVPTSRILVRPEYLAPERVNGRRCTQLSDVYGLGVLGYELLTGRAPFSDPDPFDPWKTQLKAVRLLLKHAPEPVATVIMRCLAAHPEHRYPSASTVKTELLEIPRLPRSTARPAPQPLPQRFSSDAALATPSIEVNLDDLAVEPAPAESELPLVRGVPVGNVLGQYELVDLLGQGGMGKVFLAQHVHLGRQVALKVLNPEFAQDPNHLRRFFQEAHVVNRINHPHIVEITDFVTAPDGPVYLVMEALRGETLRALMKKGPVSISLAVHIMRQVCEALAAAHAVGVVHRDVKPDNIFLIRRDREAHYVKLLDFGIAKLRARGDDELQHTGTGMVLGTPSFMAPEQALGGPVDHRSDQYSVGTVLYTLLKGARPFSGNSFGTMIARLVTQPPEPLPQVAASGEIIAPALRAAVLRCLEKNPANRFGSVEELAQALAPFDAGGETPRPI